jgi:hypothetical protein
MMPRLICLKAAARKTRILAVMSLPRWTLIATDRCQRSKPP